MTVERSLTDRIAALARLHFEPDELETLTEELNHILEHVEALRSLEQAVEAPDADDEPQAWQRPSTRGAGAETPDELERGAAALAPEWRDGFFVVPPLPGTRGDDGT